MDPPSCIQWLRTFPTPPLTSTHRIGCPTLFNVNILVPSPLLSRWTLTSNASTRALDDALKFPSSCSLSSSVLVVELFVHSTMTLISPTHQPKSCPVIILLSARKTPITALASAVTEVNSGQPVAPSSWPPIVVHTVSPGLRYPTALCVPSARTK